ncbi:MAG: hypothetical protein WA672_09960 [Candidatus Angelobacter sp.]
MVWPELLSITPVATQQPGEAVFEMKLTNRSRSDLLVPVDPNSADFDHPLRAGGTSTLDMIEISIIADRTSDKGGLHGAELVQNFMNSNGVVVGNAAGK